MGVARRGQRWRARVETPMGQRSKTFELKRDAVAWEAEQKARLRRGDFVDPASGRTTFAEFYAEWAERQVWESGTVRAMDLAVRGATFRDLPLSKIRRSHVEQWVKSMSVAGLAPSTITTRYNNVGNVLRAAVRDRFIATNPAEGVQLPRQRRREASMTLPTPEQVAAILRASSETFRPFVALCAFAGLRLGEAAGVQVGDVDFLRRRLEVTRQIQRTNGKGIEIRPPKYGSERTVYLPDELLALLAEHIKNHVGPDEPRWLFRGEGENPPHQNSIGYLWRSTCKRAGVSGQRLHDLRHWYASGLIASGCDVVTTQRALGHASATTTLRTYSHLWPDAEDRTRQAATQLMTAASSGQNRSTDTATSP